MTYYPGAAIQFDYKVNFTDTVVAEDVNLAYDEIIAIGNTIGTSPLVSDAWGGGSFSSAITSWPSLKARIQNIENGVYSALSTGVSASGGTVITTTNNSVISLSIKGKNGQTADLFNVQPYSSTDGFKVDKDGIPYYNSKILATINGTENLSNKTLLSSIIDGANNTISNIAATSVVVTTGTNIKQYVDVKPNVTYSVSSSAPSSPKTGDLWVKSDTDITSFDPTAFISASSPSVAYNSYGYRRVIGSTSAPTSGDGADGDIWLQYIA